MIKSVVIKNFKSLKNLNYQCAGLNLLMGLNGSGKSSFLQSLLFLRKCAALGKKEPQKVNLTNDLFDIGTDQDLFYAYNREDATIGCCFEKGDSECSGAICLKRGDGAQRSLAVEPDFFDGLRGSVLSRIRYISTDRLQTEKERLVKGKDCEPGDFGSRGENVISYLENKSWGSEHDLHWRLRCAGCESLELQDQIDAWLQCISPGVSIEYDDEESGESKVVKIRIRHDNVNEGAPSFRPQNVGYGISYALYIISLLLTSRAGEIVIIEDPEAHLHPRGQAVMGELIARAVAAGVQVFVETHSDHIINGVRVAVKKGVVSSQDVNIAFFRRREHEIYGVGHTSTIEMCSECVNIKIDRKGSLSEYPEDFLSEWSNQMLELLK